MPVGIGNYEWYGVAKYDENIYIGKYNEFSGNHISFEKFSINEYLLSSVDDATIETMKWFSKDFYVAAKSADTLRFYNMQCDMQGTRYFADYKSSTAFYFQIWENEDGKTIIETGMHPKNK